MTINALVTGSHKYGAPGAESDIDVVLYTISDVSEEIWRRSLEDNRAFFERVKFFFDDVPYAQIQFGNDHDGDLLLLKCGLSEDDEAIIGGLHRWTSVDKQNKSFTSTYINHEVNLVPVCDVRIWNIWQEGTATLLNISKQHGPVPRALAIDTFTLLGIPRFKS